MAAPHSHSHGPPTAGPSQPQPQPGQLQQAPGPPPEQLLQSAALLDSLPFNTIPFLLAPQPPRPTPPNLPPNTPPPPPLLPKLVCPEHKLEKCGNCGINFEMVNRLDVYMTWLAPGMVPPPPQIQFGKNAEQIKAIREAGNEQFKQSLFPQAINLYSQSINATFSRPLWENAAFTRDESVAALLNRSAGWGGLKDWPAAYADADACIKLNNKNSKAYFRKAKALVELKRVEEAYEVMTKGLTVDPTNEELIKYHSELKKQVDALRPIPEPEVQAIAEAKDEDEEKAEDEGESSAGVDEKLGGLKIGEAEQGEKDGKRGKAEKGSESASEGE